MYDCMTFMITHVQNMMGCSEKFLNFVVYLDARKNVLYHSIFAICYFVLICYYVLLDAGKPLFL